MEADVRPADDEMVIHAPEPWTPEGRYVRDLYGTIVVRGRSPADARRIAAAINATRGIPTDALETWTVQDVSDPDTRPELEVLLPDAERPTTELSPPPDLDLLTPVRGEAAREASFLFERRLFERRVAGSPVRYERRRADRRRA